MSAIASRDTFRSAGDAMVLTPTLIPRGLEAVDSDRDGRIAGSAEFQGLHDALVTMPASDERIGRTLGSIRQVEAPGGRLEPTLGSRQRLAEVPQLAGIAQGIGRLRRVDGPTLGTGSIQDALGIIASRLSDHSGCAIDTGGGRFRGFYGAKTEAAVKEFQEINGLRASGEVDAATLAKLDERLAQARTTRVNDVTRTDSATLRGIFYGDRFGRLVNLTFDDGPHPRITPEVLRILEEEGVRGATFFVLGQNVRQYPQLVRSIVAKGHVLGNHTFDHPNLTQLSADEIRDQLRRTQAAVNQALGEEHKLKLVRPPYGATNARVKDVFAQEGLSVVMWQVDSEDWRNRSTPDRVLTNVFDGSNSVNRSGGAILFHDIQPATEQRLRSVIRGLKERDFELTSAQALLDAKYA